jgi:hypothetical protein
LLRIVIEQDAEENILTERKEGRMEKTAQRGLS